MKVTTELIPRILRDISDGVLALDRSERTSFIGK